MRAPGAVPWEYSTSRAISIEFVLLNLHPTELAAPVHTCPLPAGSDGARADASVALTPAGEQAATQLRAAREAGIDRLVTEWQPDQVPELRRLIGQITTTLVATDPAPEHDAVGAPAARPAT